MSLLFEEGRTIKNCNAQRALQVKSFYISLHEWELQIKRRLLTKDFLRFAINPNSVIRNNIGKQMAKMLTYFFKIEMFKAAITGSVEKNHYQHDFCL